MNKDEEKSNQRLLNMKQKEINDLTLANKRLEKKLKQTEFLAETRFQLGEATIKELRNTEAWAKILFVLAFVFLAFIFMMFRYYSNQKKEIVILKENISLVQDSLKFYNDMSAFEYHADTLAVASRVLDSTIAIPTVVFKNF